MAPHKARAIATPIMDEVKKTVGLHHLKNVLVTGAAKRLGRAIALDLAAAGWNVAIHYHGSEDDADSAVLAARAFGVEAAALKCDLSKEAETAALVDAPPRKSAR